MKAKKIAIVHIDKDFKSIARAERVFNNIIEELENEGRHLSYISQDNKFVVFDEGTKVEKIVMTEGAIGKRVTHLYVDEGMYDFIDGDRFIREALMPCVIPSGEYKHLDASADARDRLLIFDSKGNTKRLLGE